MRGGVRRQAACRPKRTVAHQTQCVSLEIQTGHLHTCLGITKHDCLCSEILSRAILIQRRTQRPVQFKVTEPTRSAIAALMENAHLGGGNQCFFPNRTKCQIHIPTRHYASVVHSWAEAARLNSSIYGTHSMRRTKATLIYKRTKKLRAVQLLLGHTKLESTVRYLGIVVDDALEISEQTDI